MSIFWPPVLNSFWRNSENRGELSHKSSNYWQQPAVLLRLNNESKPKTKWSYWPVSSLLAVTVVWSSIVVSEQNLQISAFRVFRVVSVAIYWHHIVTVPVWAEWWMMWGLWPLGHISIQPLQSFHTIKPGKIIHDCLIFQDARLSESNKSWWRVWR